MDAGAVLSIEDVGRVVLDPWALWIDELERGALDACQDGRLGDVDAGDEYLREAFRGSPLQPQVEALTDVGTVSRVGDGVAHVVGLRNVGSQELVVADGGVEALAFSLAEHSVGCLLLGPEERVREGALVVSTGRRLEVPAGEALLGRVVDPLGWPIDDRGPIAEAARVAADHAAPGVVDRQPVDTPLHSGIKVVDALVPIGRGQRQLIVGDRKIGKTTMALDVILAQNGTGVACVYCAIGQKASSVRQVVSALEERGALEHTVVVAALPGDPPAYRYLAPYTACAMAEYFMHEGGDALVVFDDLSKHAATYREISALLDRPVGREAYPGDIFYVHSRLLERSARLAPERGGGSLTALPIVETQAGDLSAFIPTNVISICDGQIVLDSVAFNEGRRPAMDPGLSVSRVGGAAQRRIMRRIAGRLRIDLAQYEEMARFVKFGAELDDATRRQLRRGERARALLVQDQHSPMSTELELMVLYAAVSGTFDEVLLPDLPAAEADLLAWMRGNRQGLLGELREAPDLTGELQERLDESLSAFMAQRSAAAPPEPGDEHEAGAAEELESSEAVPEEASV
ncbi:MAG: F0F1 ATP synthase subunit alpha [Coriobacteriales bacterium]|nr:F0F1 ATP synthase subunit alpha [Coriobacteriales bacterium]